MAGASATVRKLLFDFYNGIDDLSISELKGGVTISHFKHNLDYNFVTGVHVAEFPLS